MVSVHNNSYVDVFMRISYIDNKRYLHIYKFFILCLFYLFILSSFYLFCLDLVMNNTTPSFQFTLPQCVLISRTTDANANNKLLTVIYATLIPLIIGINLLLIIGMIKTRRNKFNSSHILFLTLFISDLTIGAIQLPLQIYLLWKTSEPTCFEIQLSASSIAFPICMSGTLLCVISIDRYINVVSNQYYQKIVTKKSLPVAIIFTILISLTWATFEAILKRGADITRIANGYLALSVYAAISILINVAFNIALLVNVLKQRKDLSTQKRVDSRLTKTIALIVAVFVTAYLPAVITLNYVAYTFNHSTDRDFIQKVVNDFFWTLIPTQVNAVLNSAIFLSRNKPIKSFYYELFNCRSKERSETRNLKLDIYPATNLGLDLKD